MEGGGVRVGRVQVAFEQSLKTMQDSDADLQRMRVACSRKRNGQSGKADTRPNRHTESNYIIF